MEPEQADNVIIIDAISVNIEKRKEFRIMKKKKLERLTLPAVCLLILLAAIWSCSYAGDCWELDGIPKPCNGGTNNLCASHHPCEGTSGIYWFNRTDNCKCVAVGSTDCLDDTHNQSNCFKTFDCKMNWETETCYGDGWSQEVYQSPTKFLATFYCP